MVNISLEDFYHDLRQDVLSGSEARQDFLESEFILSLAKELEDSGVIEGFEPCHYKAQRGMRVDGYWFKEDEAALDLFILDFANRESIESLTQTDTTAILKRLENFFTNSIEKKLYQELEETSLGYGLARDIYDRRKNFSKVNLYLISERNLSERVQGLEETGFKNWTFSYNIWDLSRFYRLQTSKGAKEDLVVDFEALYGKGLPCLPAHLNNTEYESYLLVMPAKILSDLYGKYGTRLLEQNVRCFLQARGNVNKGIRATIINNPEMFFAYNNGITATAKEVIVEQSSGGIWVKQIKDLQIVNGGQTTASLFHTNFKDNVPLDNIFVQMKLSVVADEEKSEIVVPKISEYANTQNKVNAADFFSNHAFHIRMQEFSQRLWAPPQQGALRETKWFYERTRGQYTDALSKLNPSGRKKFQAEYPKKQMFTKTDLAKFENVWDDKPTYVNLGAQKNFAKYAERIGKEWEKDPDRFSEFYYKRIVARAIIFKETENLISAQDWYQGGYRANIVAYTLALISEFCKTHNCSLNFLQIWNKQQISAASTRAIELIAKIVSDDISKPTDGITNISEWCKKESCWYRLKDKINVFKNVLPPEFITEMVSTDRVKEEEKDASKTQVIDNGIQAQTIILQYSGEKWKHLLEAGKKLGIFTPKEVGILEVAARIPGKIPSPKQSEILLSVLDKAELEEITLS